MVFSSLSHQHQTALFHQVAKVYFDQLDLDDEHLGKRVRAAFVPWSSRGKLDSRPLIIGRTIFFGGASMDLTTKPQMLRLFEVFLRHGGGYLQRDRIVEQLYNVKTEDLSARLLTSLRNNVVKLVSRARASAAECFCASSVGANWFVHDYKSRSWKLMEPLSRAREVG